MKLNTQRPLKNASERFQGNFRANWFLQPVTNILYLKDMVELGLLNPRPCEPDKIVARRLLAN